MSRPKLSPTDASADRARPLIAPPWAVAAAGVALAGLLLITLRDFYNDDAFIPLRYARNLLDGAGIVWNPGERVEGYTSLLWVLCSAALGIAGLDLVLASRLLGMIGLLLLLVLLAVREGPDGSRTALLLGSMGPLAAWAIGGLETLGFACLISVALLSAGRLIESLDQANRLRPGAFPPGTRGAAFRVGLVFGLAELCRPEATLFAAVAIGCLLATGIRRVGPRDALRMVSTCALGFAVLFVPRLLWRIAYYRDFVPNTFHVKAGAGFTVLPDGLLYLADFLLYYPALPLLALAGWHGWRTRPLAASERFALLASAVYLLYVVWIGGDHMQWFRFLVPILPMLFLVCARRIAPSALDRRREALSLLLILVFCFMNVVSTVHLARERRWGEMESPARNGRAVGLQIRDAWPRGSLVALNTAGSTPYYSGLPCIDMLGLNDKRVARRKMPPPDPGLPWAGLQGHHKGDGAYVLSRSPRFIIFGGSEGYPEPWFSGDFEIYSDLRFKRAYRLREVMIPTGGAEPLLFRYYERMEP
ncbi:MAG: hypothetical protein FJY88_00345 [Candidatus Eisenbacteria bacterium]|nr:hypothetical protein [Candidatus Eisenbacteria bacterium]